MAGLPNPKEKGTRREITLRPGQDGHPGWGGMYLAGTPSSNPPHRPRFLQNVDFPMGGDLAPRPGVLTFNTTAFHAASRFNCIQDFQSDPFRLYFITSGCLGNAAVGTGFSVNWYNHEEEPQLQTGVYYISATGEIVLGFYGGRVVLGIDTKLKQLKVIIGPWGTTATDLAGRQQDEVLDEYTGFTLRTLGVHGSTLLAGLDNGAGASKMESWDGITSRDDLITIDVPTMGVPFRDLFVVGFAAASNQLRVRAADGTWSTVAGGGTAIQSYRAVSFKDVLYISEGPTGGLGTRIWSFDGTSIAIARTIVGATISGLAQDGEFLYYGYQNAANNPIIGRFDGSTWTDAHFSGIQALYGATDVRSVEDLRWFRGFLFAGGNGPGGGYVARSERLNTAGTWASIQAPVASSILFRTFLAA